jgi:hypothetical protein
VPDPPQADKIHGFRDASATCAKEQAPAVVPTAVPTEVKPPPVVEPVPPPPPPEPTHTLRTAGIATMAAGAVAAGLGIYFTIKTSGYASDREGICPNGCMWTQADANLAASDDSKGKSAQRWAVVSYAVAGAAIAGGAIMYAMGRDTARSTPTIGAVPQPGGAMVVAGFGF